MHTCRPNVDVRGGEPCSGSSMTRLWSWRACSMVSCVRTLPGRADRRPAGAALYRGTGRGQGRYRHRRRLRAQAGLHRLPRSQHGRCRGRWRDLHLTIGVRVLERLQGGRCRGRCGVPYGNYAGDNMNVKLARRRRRSWASGSRPWSPTTTCPPPRPRSAASVAASPARCSCGRSAARRLQWVARSMRSSRPPRKPSTTRAASGWA